MEFTGELPRLTKSLRAFANLSSPRQLDREANSLDFLRRKKAQELRDGFTWSQFRATVDNDANSGPVIQELLHSLRMLANDLTGGDQAKDVVDEATIFLLRLFLGERIVLRKHLSLLKQMFGQVSQNMADKICTTVGQIHSMLTDSCLDTLEEAWCDSGGNNKRRVKKLFGEDIRFTPAEMNDFNLPDVSFLTDLSTGIEAVHSFSMKYDGGNSFSSSTKEDKKPVSKRSFGRPWLVKELQKCYGSQTPAGLSVEEFCETVMTLLKSGRSNDELQNEMFELLGFDRFELIQLLLQHRNDIVFNNSVAEEKKLIAAQGTTEQRRPVYGCQVVVQSEQEKLLMKQARKEEKKINKLVNKDDDSEDDEFNPIELRAKRQAALKAALNAPAVKEKEKTSRLQKKEIYPHVYDSLSKAKQTAGYISEVKMLLPEGVERKDTKQYEEVNIPVSEPPPTSVGSKLVPIDSLDEVGQMAFNGVKKLNRIQSVVFDSAYHTNENLLICAPTGAGKTNVALLTVVHTIRQFIDKGVIQKDKFKVMVFVHARNATIRTAMILKEMASQKGQLRLFEPEDGPSAGNARKTFQRARSKQLAELFQAGFSVHHAGLLRSDRSMVEKYFGEGLIKVLVCTSTLAWGVNLPAHAVIIRGTELYDSKHGSFVDLGILDVLQIFGRAGRPQFDTSGHGIIITSHDKLSHYLSLLTNQFPIESNFTACLADNLNAEITLGTISNVEEAVEWLSYTYLFVRMRINPQVYGISYQDIMDDPLLERKRKELINTAAIDLDKAKMIRYVHRTGDLSVTDLGRTASYFYIKYDTIELFNEKLKDVMNEPEILGLISQAQEFEQLKVREDEMKELDELLDTNCYYQVLGGSENLYGKVNILLQTFLSRGRVTSFSLISDLAFVTQNAVRIVRALFDIMLRKNNPLMAGRFLAFSQMFEREQWEVESEMRQFNILSHEIIFKLEEKNHTVHDLREMDSKEIGLMLRHARMGETVKKCAHEFPLLNIEATLHPITRTVLKIKLQLTANFRWNDKVHGKTSETFWIWVEDPASNFMYHSEYFLITRKQVISKEPQELVMTIPLHEPLPSQYMIRATADRWLGSATTEPLSFQHLILPESHPPHTDLLELQPLPVTALADTQFELLYSFTHFNPIQTQIFHCLYHTDHNVLLGAPTGSGKTIAAEIAMFRVFKQYPGTKVVYIAPLKALVRERIEDWKVRLENKLNYSVVELTGDVTPDVKAIASANVIVTTPEKWDGISRSWQTRGYVRAVSLIIIDEIHLLGEDRGPILEVIVSRTNFISSHTSKTLRIVGLSTALANARDLANWLGIGQMGLYNFRPSVRPVPLEVHISGFPGKHYCPRMATMNRPTFQAIRQHSPAQPVLIFVSSRRQTRLTALDLIAFLAGEEEPKQWLHTNEQEMEQIVGSVKDPNLKLTLAFGIGMHHAGLQERDRRTVEELFVNQKIQVLIATATLAWGVNFPAHLVVVKGTEYYDGKVKRYVDMPITDILQMMGRAGRPQFDNQGIAVVLVHDVKKNFYKKFLYEPFPVESSLLSVLPDHLNAEIVAGSIKTRQEALDYLTWTYFFRRLLQNPSYYGLETLEPKDINMFLSSLIEKSLNTLSDAHCIYFEEDGRGVTATSMGRIASYYYLSHLTMLHFRSHLNSSLTLEQLLEEFCNAFEYSQLPVRHNEDQVNGELAKDCPLPVDPLTMDSPHTKALLLFQTHFSRLPLPMSDYYTDLKSVLDQAIRILQAMIDTCAEQGWLATTLRVMQIMQMIIQGRWLTDSPLTTLPHIEPHNLYVFKGHHELATLPGLMQCTYKQLASILTPELDEGQVDQIYKVIRELPDLKLEFFVRGCWEGEEEDKDRKISRNDKGPPTVLHADQEYTLCIKMIRLNQTRERKGHAPKFSKAVEPGWFLVLGSIETQELLALKRVMPVTHHTTQQLLFTTPAATGRHVLTLYIMSDTYLGLDQQYNIKMDILPPIAAKTVDMY
ncbi:activating signal cointegrator 1 complex subunit obelus isoform X4 [Lycorma delicatula]|uniref:activating signal cointegrator 1 complex subunit obelus isoform X4 n=1 Tax=Lycorma delicatula TaxID=130591 RepID=UPI003F50EDAC